MRDIDEALAAVLARQKHREKHGPRGSRSSTRRTSRAGSTASRVPRPPGPPRARAAAHMRGFASAPRAAAASRARPRCLPLGAPRRRGRAPAPAAERVPRPAPRPPAPRPAARPRRPGRPRRRRGREVGSLDRVRVARARLDTAAASDPRGGIRSFRRTRDARRRRGVAAAAAASAGGAPRRRARRTGSRRRREGFSAPRLRRRRRRRARRDASSSPSARRLHRTSRAAVLAALSRRVARRRSARVTGWLLFDGADGASSTATSPGASRGRRRTIRSASSTRGWRSASTRRAPTRSRARRTSRSTARGDRAVRRAAGFARTLDALQAAAAQVPRGRRRDPQSLASLVDQARRASSRARSAPELRGSRRAAADLGPDPAGFRDGRRVSATSGARVGPSRGPGGAGVPRDAGEEPAHAGGGPGAVRVRARRARGDLLGVGDGARRRASPGPLAAFLHAVDAFSRLVAALCRRAEDPVAKRLGVLNRRSWRSRRWRRGRGRARSAFETLPARGADDGDARAGSARPAHPRGRSPRSRTSRSRSARRACPRSRRVARARLAPVLPPRLLVDPTAGGSRRFKLLVEMLGSSSRFCGAPAHRDGAVALPRARGSRRLLLHDFRSFSASTTTRCATSSHQLHQMRNLV